MTVIYLTFENNGYVKVQRVKDISNSETNILRERTFKKVLGKSEF